MTTKYDPEIRLLPMNTQVLVRLRPEITGTVTRDKVPYGRFALAAAGLIGLAWTVTGGFWLLGLVPGLFAAYQLLAAMVHLSDGRKLKPHLPKTGTTAEEVAAYQAYNARMATDSVALHKALSPLGDLPSIVGHRYDTEQVNGHLILCLRDDTGSSILEIDRGQVDALNLEPDAGTVADGVIRAFQDMAGFYTATDAFTRPPRLPGCDERMSVETVDAGHYRVDGQPVKSPGYEQISKDVAVACWLPWRERSLALHLEQLTEKRRRDKWLEDAKQETLDRLQGKADDQLVARRKAHLERISQED